MTLTDRFHRSVERVLGSSLDLPPAPIRHRLYSDAYAAWMNSRGPAVYDLHELLMGLLHRKDELTPEEDEAIRSKHGIRRKA